MTQAEGINVSGDLVKNLKDKRFVIASDPHYTELDDLSHPGKKIRKLCVPVLLYEGRTTMDYYPNKSSIKVMANLWGAEMDVWIGKMFEWKVSEQDFLGMTKNVCYVASKKIDQSLEEAQ